MVDPRSSTSHWPSDGHEAGVVRRGEVVLEDQRRVAGPADGDGSAAQRDRGAAQGAGGHDELGRAPSRGGASAAAAAARPGGPRWSGAAGGGSARTGPHARRGPRTARTATAAPGRRAGRRDRQLRSSRPDHGRSEWVLPVHRHPRQASFDAPEPSPPWRPEPLRGVSSLRYTSELLPSSMRSPSRSWIGLAGVEALPFTLLPLVEPRSR